MRRARSNSGSLALAPSGHEEPNVRFRSRFEKIWDCNEDRESARSDQRPGQGGDFRMTATGGLYVSLLFGSSRVWSWLSSEFAPTSNGIGGNIAKGPLRS